VVEYAPFAAMALPNKTKIPVGTVLAGKYRITREIGRGGMAAVYEAENVDIGKRVAIKVLAQELTASAIVVERFLREARAAASIRSPYICDVYDSGRLDDGRPFLVLELLEGESLYERMTKIRFLDTDTTITVVAQSCRGLTKAHAASIVHRDLKPENIFLTRDEEGKLLAKILDFGLAKFYAPVSGNEQQARLTREGAVFGTPAYMSPEQVRGQGAVDQRADLWALGCIVYECLTGRTVWSTEQGVAMTFAQIANAPLPKPQQFRPDLPDSFNYWFNKALDRDINRRFQTAKEFAEELASTFHHGPPSFSAMVPFKDVVPPSIAPPAPNPFLGGAPAGAPPSPPFDPFANMPASGANAPKAPPPIPAAPTSGHSDLPPAVTQLAGQADSPNSARASKLGFVAPEPLEPGAAPRGSGIKPSRPLGRSVAVLGAVAMLAGAGYVGWTQFIASPKPSLVQNSATFSGTAPPPPERASAAPTASAASLGPAAAWVSLVSEGQAALASGDLKQAARLFKEASDKSAGHGFPRNMIQQVELSQAAAGDKSPCRLAGIGRPRAYDLGGGQVKGVAAGPPSIIVGAHGPVAIWTDIHEGSEHAYTAALDAALRDAAPPVDVTPEGGSVNRPELTRADDKIVVTYWDARGAEAGIKARLLDADGHIAGPPVAVSPTRNGVHPSVARAPDGAIFVAWSNEGDTDSEDIFLRRLSPDLSTSDAPVRVTDFVPLGPIKPRARFPSIGIAGSTLEVSYKLERDPLRSIEQIRVPLTEASKGLEPEKRSARKADRTIGERTIVNADKSKTDFPAIACSATGCFLVWHTETSGPYAAFFDPTKGQPILKKKLSKGGGHPAIAVTTSGQGQAVWYEGKLLMTASIRGDGVMGAPARIARLSYELQSPTLAAGDPGEWFAAWLDWEAGHVEPYVARILCQ
jgi:eukaryotic-like serine/threonine-protein kinase